MNQQTLVPLKAPDNYGGGSVRLQRKCACEATGESCSRCVSEKKPLQRKSTNGTNLDSVPSIVNEVLASPGHPIDASTRSFMDERFGYDFSAVRLHTDSRAAESAHEVGAKAYTVGQSVVFGQGHYSPTASEGKRMFAHELAHVVQQSRGGSPSSNDAGLEREADRTSETIGSGGFAHVSGRANPSVQRLEAPTSGKEDVTKLVIDGVASSLGLNSTSSRLIRSGISGAIEGFGQQWTEGKTGEHLGGHVKDLSLRDVPAIIGGYVVGAIQGLVSPITDLWSIAVMMEQIQDFGEKLLQSALLQASALKADLDGVLAALVPLAGPLRNAFNFMKGSKLDILKMLLGFAGSQNGMIDKMEGVAHSWGNKGGKEIAKSLEEPWEEKKKEEPKRSLTQWAIQLATKPAQTVDQLGEKAGEALVSGPWGKVGNKAGYALGFAVVQVALLVFSDGIGNLIAEIGRGLGSLAKAGSVLGKTLEGVGKFLVVGGKFIAEIERAVGALISMIAKPMLPVLEPILKPFGEVMERLGKFLRRLLGVAEKEGGHLTTAAATKATGSVTHGPSVAPSSPTTPSPHSLSSATTPSAPHAAQTPKPPAHGTAANVPPDTHTGAQPKTTANAVDDAATHTPTGKEPSPHGTTEAPGTAKPQGAGVAAVDHTPIADPEPVGGGHHAQLTRDGVELCSAPPCPNFWELYKKELKESEILRKEMERIDAIRRIATRLEEQGKPDKALAQRAAKEAAELQKKLEQFKAGTYTPDVATSPTTKTLGPKPPEGWADDAIKKLDQPQPFEPGFGKKRAEAIKSGNKDFVLDQPVTLGDVDEPLAVGAKGIKPQRAVNRALDKHNRQLLDPATNRQTKHLGTDPRDIERGRTHLKTVSVTKDPEAIFTRRFDEVDELSKIFDDAVARVKEPQKYTPTGLKNRINGEIRNIIKEGQSPEAKAVREALKERGYEYKENLGFVATNPTKVRVDIGTETRFRVAAEEEPKVRVASEPELETDALEGSPEKAKARAR